MTNNRAANLALTLSTIAFTVCFASWVINAILVTFLDGQGVFSFTESQIGWLLAVPILTGALVRVPLGLLTDRFGGRSVFTILMLATAVAMFFLSTVNSYSGFLFASLAFGIAGGSFAVGIGYVSLWFKNSKQGTALGIFGMGNAGAAITTMLSPLLLNILTNNGTSLEAWRQLPQLYAGVLIVTAIVFYFFTQNRVSPENATKTVREQLAPLNSIVVWRFSLYYFLVFGSFVALAQWIVPYAMNVYQLSLTQAGILATVFILPSGLIRAGGGWLSDYLGARTVMYGVFISIIAASIILAIPKMEINSPGQGILAKDPGTVTTVTANKIVIDNSKEYALTPPPLALPSQQDDGSLFLPSINSWQVPAVALNDTILKKQLLALGQTNIYYPANFWLFAALVFVLGIATGIGKAAVFKFIPDQFPTSVGAVGGMVGLIGALGGFFFPAVWGYLLQNTGLWTSCWIILGSIALICLAWMHYVASRILKDEVPELVQLIERRPSLPLPLTESMSTSGEIQTIEGTLRKIPFFSGLSDEELKGIVVLGHNQSIAAHQTIFSEGDQGDVLYIVLAGEVKIYRTGNQGQQIDLVTLNTGDVFGELALIDGKPRSAAASALVTCSLFLLERKEFLTYISKSPHMLSEVLFGLSTKVRDTTENFHQLALKERIHTEAEIERHRSISQMVAGVAHEINTPLGIVNHAASIMSDQLNPQSLKRIAKDGPAEQALTDIIEATKLIQSNIARADHLIKSFKKLSIHQITDTKECVDLYQLTKETVELFKLQAREANLDIVIIKHNISEDSVMWDGFPGLYSQIILNLLTNITRYAYPTAGGRVEIIITSNEAEQTFNIVVRDFGAGIPGENLPKLFDPFFTTGRAIGGTGLGLPIVQNIITGALKGTIRVESTLGEETRVYITMPKIIQETSEAKAQPEETLSFQSDVA